MSHDNTNPADPYSLVIAIPTINSAAYIYDSLCHYEQEARLIDADLFRIQFIICVNGTPGQDMTATQNEVARFTQDYDQRKIHTLMLESSGKNKAINQMVEYAKQQGCELIHFLDDDLLF